MLDNFILPGKMSFILGGQFGSEGKGAAAAYVAAKLAENMRGFNIITTNAGVQSGHTSIHDGQKRVLFHLPTAAVVARDIWKKMADAGERRVQPPVIYLNAGSVIDPDVLRRELVETGIEGCAGFYIHPNAAVVTDECREAEMALDSAQTKIASTRKGVGQALARKVLRSGVVAKDDPYLRQFVWRLDLNEQLAKGAIVLAEVPQGFSLSLNGRFYPHCTSRDCTVGQAMSDAGVHPSFYGASMLVVRTFPIRVGNIDPCADGCQYAKDIAMPEYSCGDGCMYEKAGKTGYSGGAYPDQRELSWEELGQPAEITTVTRRTRRVFEFSNEQLREALMSARPTHLFLSFMDYFKTHEEHKRHHERVIRVARQVGLDKVRLLFANGPTTADVI